VRGLTTRAALRDASLATAGVVAAIFAGSGAFAHVDPALVGYLGATIVATFGVVFRLSGFWRRPPSAMYVRAALAALREPRRLAGVLHVAADDLVAQRFIARRGRLRWLAHLLLSLGTLVSFAITLPLVWGWLRFEAIGQDTYVPRLAGLAVGRFAVDGAIAWGIFHGLDLAGGAVTLGALYFLALRIRTRRGPGEMSAFHIGPLLLLLAVALSGVALPAARGVPALFDVAAVVHEALVVGLLVSLPFSKLGHVLVRPLQVGVRVLRAPGVPLARCDRCGDAFAPAAQLAAVAQLLAGHGYRFEGHQETCPACRRLALAAAQATLLGAAFHPRIAGAHPASGGARTRRAA